MYRLRWNQPFQEWLGSVWDNVSDADRLRIAQAINSLSHKLSHDPLGNSESRGGNLRMAIERPLVIDLSIDFANDVVSILRGRYV